MNTSKSVSCRYRLRAMQDYTRRKGPGPRNLDVDLWDGDWFLSHSPIISLGMVLSKGVQEKTHR